MSAPRHFLDLSEISGDELRRVLHGAATIKANWRKGQPPQARPLEGKTLAMVFDRPSTRTRVSFDVGMRQLGGETIMLTGAEMQLGRGETIADTARVLSRYVDAIMIRILDHEDLRELAEYATVPVINGLTKRSHPCQAMADVLTFEEHRGPIKGRTVAWSGDFNNVLASWIHAAQRFDFAINVATPPELAPPQRMVEWARSNGARLNLTNDPFEAVDGAQAVISDCWVSMGDEEEAKHRHNLLQRYQVNAKLMAAAAKDAIFMHCLPAHRGEEVTDDVIDGPQSVVFDEAENRMHAQKAIFGVVPRRAAGMIEVARPVSDIGLDDCVLPFAVSALDTRGRVVRLGPAIDAILARHDYPAPVARLLGEATALTALLGSSLKMEGRFQLQTRGDGPVDMLVVDFDAPDRLRAYARFDAARIAALAGGPRADLLGRGHLAFTIERGDDSARYQGVVPLAGQGLESAANDYFRQSEQIPTLARLAVAQSITPAGAQWRAGGLMAQFLPDSPERRRRADLDPGDAPKGAMVPVVEEDDSWTEARLLAATVEDHELVDPMLSSERLLYRLFHERGVTVFDPAPLRDQCRCSDDRVRSMLRNFSSEDRRDMVGDDGKIGVTCEFCSTKRVYEPAEFEG